MKPVELKWQTTGIGGGRETPVTLTFSPKTFPNLGKQSKDEKWLCHMIDTALKALESLGTPPKGRKEPTS